MSSLDNMKTRLSYAGGGNQQDRMIESKLRSLKKAMLYSYQAATAVLEDGREFRCLINPDNTREEYRDKIISIPFEDIRVGNTTETVDPITGETIRVSQPVVPGATKTSMGVEPIGMKVGDTFEWKEDGTYWMVYLRYEEERAYFRGEIRNCDYEIEINGKKYRGYLRGPDQDETLWRTKHNISWTDVDYTALLYITSNEETRNYFHRYQKLEIYGRPWEVQVVDPISNNGLIMVALKETFRNSMEAETLEQLPEDNSGNDNIPEVPEETPGEEVVEIATIEGAAVVYPYDKKKYTIKNAADGYWIISNEKKAKITHQTSKSATIEIVTGRSGEVSLTYKRDNEEDIVFNIQIASL